MENRVELRLWRLGAAGLKPSVCLSGWRVSAEMDGGRDAECECDVFDLDVRTGDGGFETTVAGSSLWHISQVVRSGWLRKVQRGHCFFWTGDADVSSAGGCCC